MSDSSVEHRDSTKASSSSGVSSDCSDSDHEIEDHKTVFEYHIEAIEASTQTATLEEQKSELTYLTLEIEKLTKFKHHIENNDGKENASQDNPDQMALEELDDLRVNKALCSRYLQNVKLRQNIKEFFCHQILREIIFGKI